MDKLGVSLLLLLTFLPAIAQSSITANIYWEKGNQIFSPTNDKHRLSLELKDKVRFHCPDGEDERHNHTKYYVIYRVPKTYYETCFLPPEQGSHRLKRFGINKILTCKGHSKHISFATLLEQFSALPGSHGGLTYHPGKTYYFMSVTIGPNDVETISESCEKHNMKIEVNVIHNNQADRPERSYPSYHYQMLESPPNVTVTTREPVTAVHSRRHRTEGRPHTGLPPIGGLKLEQSTITYRKPAFPQAIINAEVTLPTTTSSSSTSTSLCTTTMLLLLVFWLLAT